LYEYFKLGYSDALLMDCVIARILAHYKYPLTSVGNNLILNSTPFAAISSFRTKAKRNLIKHLSHWRGKGAYLPRQRGVYALTIYACIYICYLLWLHYSIRSRRIRIRIRRGKWWEEPEIQTRDNQFSINFQSTCSI